MPNKCAAYGCDTNYDSERNKYVDEGGQKVSTFYFPLNNPTLLPLWIAFVNRVDWDGPSKCSVLCEKHFNEELINRGKVRNKLIWDLNPIPTVHSAEALKPPSVLMTPNVPRKLPKERCFQEDEMKEFVLSDTIGRFEEIDFEKIKKSSLDSLFKWRQNF